MIHVMYMGMFSLQNYVQFIIINAFTMFVANYIF